MGFKEKIDAWFPGATGAESEGAEAERVAAELQALRENRANVALFQNSSDKHGSDLPRIEELDRQIAEKIARLKELGVNAPQN